jgi:hypothetical protein
MFNAVDSPLTSREAVGHYASIATTEKQLNSYSLFFLFFIFLSFL